MKGLKVLAVVLMVISGAASASTESDIYQAKEAMGKAFYKFGVLTGSFTEQGKENGSVVGSMLANKLAGSLNDSISGGLNQGVSCSDIKDAMMSRIQPEAFYKEKQGETLSPVAKKQFEKVVSAVGDYISAQCTYLSE